jgi:hypothetical protein
MKTISTSTSGLIKKDIAIDSAGVMIYQERH